MPTGTLEGANEPLALPMFPGWGAISSLAALLVAPFTAALVLLVFLFFMDVPTSLASEVALLLNGREMAAFAIFVASTLFLLAMFRFWLLERWEDRRFVVGHALGRMLNCQFKDRMGHVLYRMELAVFEARRVGIDLSKFHQIAVHIEDRRFHRHGGNDWVAVLRAIWQRWKYGFVSGGSTIHQQLFRSTCLKRIQRRWTRKVIEWVMAPWVNARYDKTDILNMYLCSARFDRGVIGLSEAVKHFFGVELNSTSKWSPIPAQAIFLIERLSNISRSVAPNRLKALVASLKNDGLITQSDVRDLEFLYATMIRDGYVRGKVEEIVLQ